jgi:hypothetical protein
MLLGECFKKLLWWEYIRLPMWLLSSFILDIFTPIRTVFALTASKAIQIGAVRTALFNHNSPSSFPISSSIHYLHKLRIGLNVEVKSVFVSEVLPDSPTLLLVLSIDIDTGVPTCLEVVDDMVKFLLIQNTPEQVLVVQIIEMSLTMLRFGIMTNIPTVRTQRMRQDKNPVGTPDWTSI